MLKIAAADATWLQQTVLSERRRLASLHHAALTETKTALDDHTGPGAEGYKTVVEDKGIVTASLIDRPELTEGELEAINEANNYLLEEYPGKNPQELSALIDQAYEPGLSITELVSKVLPMLNSEAPAEAPPEFAHVSTTKKADQSPNVAGDYAVTSHQGEEIYKNALDPKVGSAKKAEAVPASKDPNEVSGYAAESHASEMSALAAQVKRMTSNPDFDPNDPLKD